MRKMRQGEGGFTLIELLVVIIILGILSAVVVFAVRGTGDKGRSSALKIDIRTLETAEQAYCAKTGTYGTQDQLTGQMAAADGNKYKFLSESSKTHDVTTSGGGRCGTSLTASDFVITGPTGDIGPNGGGPFRVGFGPYGTNAAPAVLNPAVSTQGSMQAASGMLFNGLVGLSANATPFPELAESWDITNNGATYKFILRPGVLWSDSSPAVPGPASQPLLAQDVKFSYEAALLIWHARTSSSLPSAFAKSCVDPGGTARRLTCDSIVANENDAAAGGKRTVTFSFAQPFGPLLQQMGMTDGAIIPSHIFPSCVSGFTGAAGDCPTTGQPWPTGQPAVGTGPFKVNVLATNPTVGLVYDRNANYFRKDSNNVQLPFFNQVILAPANTLGDLQAGTIDYLPGMATQTDVNSARSDSRLIFDTGTFAPGGSTNCIQTVMFNLWANSVTPTAIRTGTPTPTPDQYLGDPTPVDPDGAGPEVNQPKGQVVRRAIAMSLKRKPNLPGLSNPGYVSISKSPGAELATSPTNTGMPVGSTPAPLPEYDLAKANLFLDNAGFPDGNGPAAGGRFSLGLSSFAGVDLANAMHDDMGAAGIDVVPNPGATVLDPPFPTVGPYFSGRNFDMLIVSSCQNTDPEMGTRRVYHKDAVNGASFTNGSGYNNATVNSLFDQGRASVDPAVRNQKYKQINDIVGTELPTLWLTQTRSNRAYKATCSGIRPYTGAYPEYGSCVR